jgi:hypothetical protein
MRREWGWAITAALALTIGVTCAAGYARLALPYYTAVTSLIADFYPWRVVSLAVTPDPSSHGMVLRLSGEVRRHRDDAFAAAMVVNRVQVGEAIETPVIFWGLLLAWPALNVRQRFIRLAVGVPVFLALEGVTTACQLVYSMAQASAMLAGEENPLSLWERWSRFLEAGGRFVVEVSAALITVGVTSSTRRHVASVTATNAQMGPFPVP